MCVDRGGGVNPASLPQVPTPPFVSDVVSEAQLVEELARLVAGNPSIQRWLLKLPHHTRGRGFGE